MPDKDSKAQRDQVSTPNRFRILGVGVDALQIPGVIHEVENWIQSHDGCHFIAVTGMHGVMEAQHEAPFKAILNSADLVVPAGMPLVWISRLRGYRLRRRVYGPELMSTVFATTADKGYRHFLYGGEPGVAERLARCLQRRFPGTKIAGCYSPPFRALTADEDASIVERIENAQSDIVWVGLSTPKQEQWMDAHRDKLRVPVLVGVGAAFDFLAGTKRQAPAWIREHGLEWLFRLLQEPERLWRRYVVYGSEFVFLATLELLGLRKWD